MNANVFLVHQLLVIQRIADQQKLQYLWWQMAQPQESVKGDGALVLINI
jgi:hypothetical protein